MPTRSHGFTLIEALITLLIVAILLLVAVPAWSGVVAATHAGNARSALYDSLLGALNHSTISGSHVVVCSSHDGVACSGSVDWSSGWMAFADFDRDRNAGHGEPRLRRQVPLTHGVHLRSTAGRTRIVFQPHGGVNAGSNVTFTLCDRRGPDKATTVVIGNSGSIRQGLPTRAAALDCAAGD